MSPLRDHASDPPGLYDGDDGDALSLEDRLHDVNLHTTGTYRVRVGDKGRDRLGIMVGVV